MPEERGPDRKAASEGLARAMAKIGDRWSLLVVQALLEAPRRFSELESAIPGLAPNILAARLRRLEEAGLVAGSAYSDRPLRLEYRVTEDGRELAGALRLLARWGDRQGGGEGAGPSHDVCGTGLEARWYCPTCARVAEAGEDDVVWL